LHFVAKRIERADVKVLDVKQAAELLPDFTQEIILIESGAESAANLVQNVKLLGAAGSLLNEEAVFDGHADLVAESQQESVFGGGKPTAVRSAKEKNAKGVLLGLQADGHDAAKTLREGQLAEAAYGLFAFESGDGVVIAKIAETQKAAETRNESNEIIVKPLLLRGPAEVIT
jgi:hypothetical protein